MPTQASVHSAELADTIANAMSWFVVCVIPIAALVAFWLVHVLPKKIAHKNLHPPTQAIKVLCMLSLVFGGLLRPLAWLWAYSKAVSYRSAYGTDKHEDHHLDMAHKFRAGLLSEEERLHLREELDSRAAKGALAPELRNLRTELQAVASASATVGGTA